MQKFVSELSERDGTYNVSRWNEVNECYEVIEKGYLIEAQAIERAQQLNMEYQDECDELGE